VKIVHLISSLQRGGAEVALAQLITQLKTHAEHYVIFFYDGPLRAEIEALGVPCHQISARGSSINPLFFFKLLRTIKRIEPDCLLTGLWLANVLGRICGRTLNIPCIAVLHALLEHEGSIRTWIDRIIPCQATAYVAVSNIVHDSFRKHHPLLLHKQCFIIPHGIDYAHVIRASKQPISLPDGLATALANNQVIVGSVGRLVPDKNYALLLKSFSAVAESTTQIHLVIVGSGPEEAQLKRLATQHEITDRMTWISGQPAYPYYQYFDYYVQPSRYEAFGLAILEAQCFALPVLATGKKQLHPIITHLHNGMVIEPDNSEALTRAMLRYLQDPALRARDGKRGLETAREHFSIKKSALAYYDMCTKICKEREQ